MTRILNLLRFCLKIWCLHFLRSWSIDFLLLPELPKLPIFWADIWYSTHLYACFDPMWMISRTPLIIQLWYLSQWLLNGWAICVQIHLENGSHCILLMQQRIRCKYCRWIFFIRRGTYALMNKHTHIWGKYCYVASARSSTLYWKVNVKQCKSGRSHKFNVMILC